MSEQTMDYSKLAQAIIDEPEKRLDAQIATWPENLQKLIPARGSVPTADRAAEVRRYQSRADLSREVEAQRATEQARLDELSRINRANSAKIAQYRADYTAWQDRYRRGEAQAQPPSRPELQDENRLHELNKIDGKGTRRPDVDEAIHHRGQFKSLKANF